MASDITLAVGDGSRRMTYAELADIRRISVKSAERLVRRRWPKQTGNDGVVRVLVPLKDVSPASQRTTRVRPQMTGPDIRGQTEETFADDRRTLERAIDVLSAQLEHEWTRADDERARAERSETERRWLQVKLDDTQAQLTDAVTAERIARGEAAGLRAELDARRTWGLRRRLRWALSGRRGSAK
jgi:hypothetical protein